MMLTIVDCRGEKQGETGRVGRLAAGGFGVVGRSFVDIECVPACAGCGLWELQAGN